MKWVERLIYVLGILIILFGLIMTAGGLMNLFNPSQDDSVGGLLTMIGLLGIVPIVVGLMMCLKMKRNTRHRKDELLERQILQLAKDNQGQLTISEVSMQLSLSSAEAKAVLDQCHLNNLAELQMSDTGVVVYRFQML